MHKYSALDLTGVNYIGLYDNVQGSNSSEFFRVKFGYPHSYTFNYNIKTNVQLIVWPVVW